MCEIRRALPADLVAIIDLYIEAQEWLRERGLSQWQPSREPADRLLDRVRSSMARAIAAGTCLVAESEQRIVGTITVDDFADPEFWTEADEPSQALYVHRMIVSRRNAGRGLGNSLLDRAAEKAAEQGKRWLRLDAWQTNEALHRYYKRQGFAHVRTLNYAHRGSGALFQRPITQPRLGAGLASHSIG